MERKAFEEAAAAYTQLVQLESSSVYGWLGIGLCALRLSRWHDAQCALQQANCLDNTRADIWAYLALVCLQREQFDQADQCVQVCLELGSVDASVLR